MKSLKALWILFIIILSGCMRENIDDCPVQIDNLLLRFEFTDQDNKQLTKEYIDKIDVLFFDDQHNLQNWVQTRTIHLPDSLTLALSVEPGEYYILAWANAFTYEENMLGLIPGSSLFDAYLNHTNQETTDPLFYSPDLRKLNSKAGGLSFHTPPVNITATTQTIHRVDFMGAHHKFNIYLKGFEEVGKENLENPRITIKNSSAGYDFLLNPREEKTTFSRQATDKEVDHTLYGYTPFNLPHFTPGDQVELTVEGRNSTQAYTFTLDLYALLDTLGIEIDNKQLEIVELIIEFEGTHIKVSVPDWKGSSIGGGLDN